MCGLQTATNMARSFAFIIVLMLFTCAALAQLQSCPKINVCFAIDESGSINDAEFATITETVKGIAARIEEFDSQSAYSAVGFSRTAELVAPLTSDIAQFNQLLDSNENEGGTTSLAAGLNLCRDQLLNVDEPRLIVLITDGDDMSTPMGIDVAPAIKDQRITIATVGIGGQINEAELREIASNNALYTPVDTFQDLLPEIEGIVAGLCTSCPASACFALDESGSISNSDFERQSQAVKEIATQIRFLSSTAQFAAVGFKSKAMTISELTEDLAAFNKSIEDNTHAKGSTSLFAGLTACRDIVLNGPEPRMIVLLTDGRDQESPEGVTVAPEIKAQGITIATIGIGNVDEVELRDDIASHPRFFSFATDFSGILETIGQVISSLCTIERLF